jgi:hypothetical protein
LGAKRQEQCTLKFHPGLYVTPRLAGDDSGNDFIYPILAKHFLGAIGGATRDTRNPSFGSTNIADLRFPMRVLVFPVCNQDIDQFLIPYGNSCNFKPVETFEAYF